MKKRIIVPLVILVLMQSSFAQTETASSKQVIHQLSQFYNAAQYDSIFNLFATNMKSALPVDKTIAFFSGLKKQAGSMGNPLFTAYQNSYAVYKTRFDNALLSVNISVDEDGRINGLFIKAFTDTKLPTPERNSVKMVLPFKEEWTVIWGGDTKELNYHVESVAQKNAFDIVITDSTGKSYRTNGLKNEDYYAFGKELYAPCDGEVVLVVDGVKDNKPGDMNPVYVPGNSVIIKAGANEYVLMAHFKQHSIKVKEGQQVKAGDLVGACGNSGNSTEPHLHLHIQNTEDMNIATGVKCYFSDLLVNGKPKNNYSPVQKDKIKSSTKTKL